MTTSKAREWVTVPRRGAVTLPAFVGGISVRDGDLAAAARDFGHHVHRRPLAVLRPGSAFDVAEIMRFGRAHGLPVVARGAGHSVDGQAQVQGGIVVDMSSLAGVHAAGPDRISVDAGARWSAVVAVTLPHGTAPPVLTDYLELSVGGTLSVGGIGGASHRHGCQADNVHELDVVTPSGELLTCSATRNASLFDAVRGSQGQHGIITRATLALAPAPAAARCHRLTYHDLGTYLADQRRLIEEERFDHVDGQARYVDGSGWRYVLEAVSAYTPPDEPDDRALLRDLAHERGSEEVVTGSYGDFLGRFVHIAAHLWSIGSWQLPHPRCNLLLPGRHAETVVSEVLVDLAPELLGLGGSVLLYAIPSARIAAPNVPTARDPLTVVLGVQRTAPPDDQWTLDRMRQANAALHQRAREIGGASYAYPSAHHDARAA